MKRSFIALVVVCMSILPISLVARPVAANPPSSVQLAYNIATHELTVQIVHTVVDPSTHYIDSVQISVNSIVVQTHPYTSQPTTSSFSYSYLVTANAGDMISVTAKCSQGPTGSASLTVSTTGGGGTTPGIDYGALILGMLGRPHVILMLVGFTLMLVGLVAGLAHKPKKSWFTLHAVLSSTGMVAAISGIFVLAALILDILHPYLGLIDAALLAIAIGIGIAFAARKRKETRKGHIWIARAANLTMCITIATGVMYFLL